jgi:hypothetical protein
MEMRAVTNSNTGLYPLPATSSVKQKRFQEPFWQSRGATGGGPEWRQEPVDLSPAGDKYDVCYGGGHHGSFSGKFAKDANSKTICKHCQSLTLAFWNAFLKYDAKAKAWLQSDAAREGSNGLAQMPYKPKKVSGTETEKGVRNR